MSEWKTYKLGELATIKGGKRLPKGVLLQSTPNSHPYIRIRDLGKTRILELDSTYEYVDDLTQKSIARYIVEKGDILLSIVGTIGLVGIVGESLHLANQTENCVKLINLNKVDRLYLYYYLSSKIGQIEIHKGIVGAVQAKLPIKNIENIEISLPPLAEQKRIADILSAIDDKIELNRRINANLEQQAQALYKSWFGEISSNITLQEITLNITDGVHNTVKDDCSGEYLLLSCKNIVGGHLVIGPNERRINKETFDKLRKRTRLSEGDILVSTVGTVGEIVILLDPPANVEFQRSVGIIKPNISKASPYYIYCALKDKQEALKHTAHGAVQQCIFIGDLKNFEIPYSYSKKLIEFDTIVSPMFNQLTINHRESNYLTQLRDTLLPKLMSGEITV